jgi:TetR/AcrR family transcriptional repressor of nem operon
MTDSMTGRSDSDKRGPGKRERLVGAAIQLLHQQGIETTTLADIAQVADVPVGNVYYYFKTKDEIIEAVIEAHVQESKEALASISQRFRTPKTRLKALVEQFAAQKDLVAQYGCPHGSLCSEIDKRHTGPALAAAQLMRVPIDWAEEQFRSLGRQDAHDLSITLLSAYQGSALLANTLRDPSILTNEAQRLNRWIESL